MCLQASRPYQPVYSPNYHATFEVMMDLQTEFVSLELHEGEGPEKKIVWSHGNLSVQGTDIAIDWGEFFIAVYICTYTYILLGLPKPSNLHWV